MEDIIKQLALVREAARERNRFLEDLAKLVVNAAEAGLDHVDSGILLEMMQMHQKKINEIYKEA